MVAKYNVLSSIISVTSDNNLCIHNQEPFLILKNSKFFSTIYQHIKVYSPAIKVTCLITGKVYVQDESVVKAIYTLALIQYRVLSIEKIL